MMKSEIKHIDKLSNNISTDALASKTMSDKIFVTISGRIDGYVQEINLNPFGLLFISDIQVCIFKV